MTLSTGHGGSRGGSRGGLWGAIVTLSTAHGGSRGGSRGAMGGCSDLVVCTRREQRRIQGGCSDPIYWTRREQRRIQEGLWGAVVTLSTAHGGIRGGSRATAHRGRGVRFGDWEWDTETQPMKPLT